MRSALPDIGTGLWHYSPVNTEDELSQATTFSDRYRRALIVCLVGLFAAAVLVVLTVYLVRAFGSRSMLPVKAEHRVRLGGEFRAAREHQTDWDDYLQIEMRLANETAEAIGARPRGDSTLDRHAAGSVSNPDEHAVNWNRSFALRARQPAGAAVLLHGLSDSPYSVRATAELMQGRGFSTFVPRMPGHGFAVGDLRHARWEDWMGAARIAMRAADRERRAGEPLILGGYSNGGLLAVRYALDCAARNDMPCPDGILLMSPAIDVTSFARLSRWHRALSWMPYFEQFQWETIMPEVDPYKFTSFPKNPGSELYRAVRSVQQDLVAGAGRLPPILAFQSVVDDTVSTEAVMRLFHRLRSNGSELVLYDVNRSNQAVALMIRPPPDIEREIATELPLPFSIAIVANRDGDSHAVQELRYAAGELAAGRRDLELAWPETVFSLSHIAIPFRPDDPVYGAVPATGALNLGGIAPRGERKVLGLTPAYFARLRHNPFYEYQHARIETWLDRWL